ncbi:MAG: uridine monophosphate kinase, partial [Pseudomonadota bacterium]
IERKTADYMGMIATVMNSLALQSVLENETTTPTRVQSAIPMQSICESYIPRRAERHLEKRRVVIFAAGSGNPYFTTDTAAALRASEMNCEVLLKATKVDGVYTDDPMKVSSAKRYDHLDYATVLHKDLRVMDGTAIAMCRENAIPIAVFSLKDADGLVNVVQGCGRYTLISQHSDNTVR